MTNNSSFPHVELYSDWWAVPNPGKWGYWVILKCKWIHKEFSEGYKNSTNNRMELTWVIVWLSKLKQKSKVEVYTDSQYTINWIEKWWAKKWKSNNWFRTKTEKAINYDLWEQLLLLVEMHDVNFNWVKWHNGHIENERCDELATNALNKTNLLVDIWFKKTNTISLFEIDEKKDIKKVIKKKNTNKISKAWDICWKCETPVIKKNPKKKKLKPEQTYYYEYFFTCPECKTNYMIPEAKREIKK